VQAKSRDALRRDDMDSIAKTLEACHTDKDKCAGAYPTVRHITDTSPGGYLDTNFASFNKEWIYDSSAGLIQSSDPSPATQYQYIATPDHCTGTVGENKCTGFTLKAYQETNPEHPYVKDSFNK
jgi:hypothetical protein